MHQIEPERELITSDDDSLYLYVNNDIEYGLFEDIVDSYYLDSQIKEDFQCDHDCYSQYRDPTNDNYSNACTHDYHHITQSVKENANDTHTCLVPKYPTIHSQRKHSYRNTFGDAHIQYHDFDNQDSLIFRDKYTALLQQELQNPYWNLHNPIMTKSYQISQEMDIETMPHAMYFTGNSDTVTKINHVLYQTIE